LIGVKKARWPSTAIHWHPALDLAPRAVLGKASLAQQTDPANRAAAGIADRHLAASLTLLTAHRPQLRAGRTATEIGCGVVAEIVGAGSGSPRYAANGA